MATRDIAILGHTHLVWNGVAADNAEGVAEYTVTVFHGTLAHEDGVTAAVGICVLADKDTVVTHGQHTHGIPDYSFNRNRRYMAVAYARREKDEEKQY